MNRRRFFRALLDGVGCALAIRFGWDAEAKLPRFLNGKDVRTIYSMRGFTPPNFMPGDSLSVTMNGVTEMWRVRKVYWEDGSGNMTDCELVALPPSAIF
jgi:hypothetical protein